RPARRLRYPRVVRCRASRSARFFRELGVDPRAEPFEAVLRTLPAPTQTLLEQDLVNPAAPHGNALLLQQIDLMGIGLKRIPSLLLGVGPHDTILQVQSTKRRRELGNILIDAPTRAGKGLLAPSQLLTWPYSAQGG